MPLVIRLFFEKVYHNEALNFSIIKKTKALYSIIGQEKKFQEAE